MNRLTALISNIFVYGRESFINLGVVANEIGENQKEIARLEDELNKTLKRANLLNDKLKGASKQTQFNSASLNHPSIRSLNISRGSGDECKEGMTNNNKTDTGDNTDKEENTNKHDYDILNQKHIDNEMNLGGLNSIVHHIKDEIAEIKKHL